MQKSKRFLALSIAVVILLVFGITMYRGRNTPIITEALAGEIHMEPTKHDSAGADLDTEFILSGQSAIDPRYIRENLTVEPAINFIVKNDAEDRNKVLLVPQEPLEPERIYKFALELGAAASSKWAFQTKGDFRVVSTLPRDKSASVPVDTGIEITFSHLNFEKLPEFFTISPQTEGSFEVHKKTAVFVPNGLSPDTLYTVTIKKGLPLANSSQVLEEDITFQFETQGESGGYNFNFYKANSEFPTDDKPLFQFNHYSWGNTALPEKLEFTVYQYKSAADYIKAQQDRQKIPFWAYRTREKYQEDTSGLEQVARLSTPVMEFDYTNFIEFPEALPAGYYLAEVDVQDIRRQVWFQVTDLSLYAAVDKNHTYIWVNDLTSGSPVSGAKIELSGGGESGVTDGTGLTRVTTPSDTSAGVYGIVSKENREAVAAISPWYQWEYDLEFRREFAMSYWKYLYLDRTLYKPNDTVHFWGIIRPRTEISEPIDKVTVVLSTGGWRENPDIESKEIVLDDFSFTDSIKLPNLTPGYYNLEIRSGDYIISSSGFEVQTYSKPAYTIEAKPTKNAIYVGDEVDFEVKATFFEGTPAAFLPLEYYIQGPGRGSITTDEEGDARVSYSPAFSKGESGSVLARRLYLTAKLPESGEITGETLVRVLNNDIDINTSYKVDGNTATLDIDLNKLTVDRVNSGQADPWERDAYKGGPAVNHPVKINVYREVWEKREDGKYYDFISKKVETRYFYEYKKVPLSESEVTTDAEGKATFSLPVENKQSYLVEITAQDFRGNPAIREHQVLGPGFYRNHDYKWYHLDGKSTYKDGEEVKLSMKQNEAELSPRPQGFLFLMSQDGILESWVQDTPDFNTVFTKELIPNFWVRGVYFDGRNYHEAYDYQVAYDKAEKALKINVKTDKNEYKPKDTVKVEVKVTDDQGKPVEAKVNLNLVDEALYALKDQHVDILGSIYSDFYSSGIKTTFFTHDIPDMPPGGAEQGGEGGSERKDFRDAVLFKTLATDKQGKTQVSFEVPDNLTSWRLTCQAVTKDLSAGTQTTPVVVKLPFFVDMVVNDTYLTGDQPTVPIRAFGSKLKSGTSVNYEAELKTSKKTVNKTLVGKAFSMTKWQLPSLDKGNYEITLTGKTAEGLTDTLTLGFNVVDSLLTKRQVDFWLLDENLKIKGAKNSLTTLTFTDYQRSQYLNLLFQLKWAGGSRIDQKIAPYMAEKLIDEYFPDMALDDMSDGSPELSQYQTPEGGIAILPYSGAELELSAKLSALCGESFDQSALENYFYKIAEDSKETRERGFVAFYGLSALGEPVLTELKLLSQQNDLTVKEQLYLALAFLETGDEPSAEELIKTVIQENGEDLGAELRINTGEDQDDILEATALAAITASGLNLDEQNKLQTYLLENSTKDILLYIEQLMFLENALPRLPEEAISFNYWLDGQQKKVTLEPRETLSLLLTPEKLATLKFADIKGQVGVTAVYATAFDVSAESGSDGVKLTRSYGTYGEKSEAFDANNIIKITLSYEFGPTAPDGPYVITDFLPAGLKIIQRPYYHGVDDINRGYPLQIDGQKVTFGVYEKKSWSFNYYARVINPGDFKAEPAVLQNLKNGKIYSVTKGDRMNIK